MDGREERDRLGDDLLVGADAIARELNWKTAKGTWNRRRVYHLAAKGTLPIRHIDGLGLCARKSALERFFGEVDAQTSDPTLTGRTNS